MLCIIKNGPSEVEFRPIFMRRISPIYWQYCDEDVLKNILIPCSVARRSKCRWSGRVWSDLQCHVVFNGNICELSDRTFDTFQKISMWQYVSLAQDGSSLTWKHDDATENVDGRSSCKFRWQACSAESSRYLIVPLSNNTWNLRLLEYSKPASRAWLGSSSLTDPRARKNRATRKHRAARKNRVLFQAAR